ncbi:vasculin-like [Oncorhynchus keta]|uniref:vasculin-like n=1 Tax=Oncorhynchus keta TaxID=8018 RepID=UPI0015F912FA|nr:vasculin-like [Oncorhynchus keta]XP_035631351.1 vasculin-like [Oncorhynchus keta]
MAQHDFTPAWLNFPTAPSSAKPSQVCDKSFQSPAKCLDNHGDVSRRRHNSSDDSEPVNGRTGGIFSRKEGNGWGVRNGSEGSSSRPPLQRCGPSPRSRSKGLPEGQQGHRDDGDRRKQFEAEDFPSLHPDADREVNRDKAVATGVWEHPPNPQSRGSKMMVIKRVSREQPTPAQTCTSTPQQQQAPSRNGTGPSLYKGPTPISVSLPVKASRSSSSSPVDKGSQPRLMMRLTRMTRSDRKSTFLKALKKDMVDEEDLYHHCKHDDGFHPQNCNVGCGDENRNRCERSFSQENGNMTTLTMRQQVLRSSTFPQQEVLSSSLEAEHRLLKEMGWQEESENDETCAPLTEDEMREFQAISEQLQKNGLRRNSFLKNGPPIDSLAVWKTSNLQMATDTTEETETSSSDTSDDDA